ncbi:MAG: anthranilate synthase component I family protein, partial [Verrucomicrobiales bacterium]|nr:anthranilate synthase component I family protein [Verrucomicrobiales bacterium]
MASQSTTPRHGLDLPSPSRLAGELRHLPGFVYLDSSSSGEDTDSDAYSRFSLIAALPEKVITGNLFDESDRCALETAYQENSSSSDSTPDLGFPGAGLYGYVTYEGEFTFGLYRNCLIYEHQNQNWIEVGDLSSHRQAPAPSPAFPRIKFRGEIEREQFCNMVATAQDYIAAGDIYQVNLSHRFSAHVGDPFKTLDLYHRLRERSPAPYAAFLDLGEREIISSSPEQFLSLSGRTIQTRPIKGTRPRFRDREQDEKSAYDLITSTKEIAELIMITDLERNDLGQICEFGTVTATELLKLERFAQVFHLVSTVEGNLRPDISHIEALHACFPGGSITGAPKKRSREIIAELEPSPRGVYTGAIGCFGFNGESRFNIAIRTAVKEGDQLHFHVGAGIVADSVPEKEWEETLHKAAGIFQATQ